MSTKAKQAAKARQEQQSRQFRQGDAPYPEAPPAEQVVVRLRPHARVLFWPTLLLFAVCGATGYFFTNLPEPWQNTLLIWVAVVAVIVGCLLPLGFWLTHRYTITTRRIIFRRGFFVRTRQELVHSRGYDVSVRQNWLQSLWRSGTVRIDTGLEHPLLMKDVPNPELVQQVLHELMHSSRTVVTGAQRQQSSMSPDTAPWSPR